VIGRRRRPLRATVLLWAGRSLFEHGRERWGRLNPEEQRELRRLLISSKGRSSRLPLAEQEELKRLLRKTGGRSHAG
jgi:hypothetical protein